MWIWKLTQWHQYLKTRLVPELTVDPGSSATTEQVVEDDASLSPELESLSSGSELEDQYYEASEESSVQQGTLEAAGDQVEEAKSATEDKREEDKREKDKKLMVSVEQHDGGGMSKDGGSSSNQQHSVDSVDKEFVMVNYPQAMTSADSDTQQQPHLQQATALSPKDESSSPNISSSDTMLTVIESEDRKQGSRLETFSSATVQPGSAESAQRVADDSQEVTVNVEGDSEGDQREAEGEGGSAGGEAAMTESESSHMEGEKGQVNVPAFESLGLLYARSPNLKHDRY